MQNALDGCCAACAKAAGAAGASCCGSDTAPASAAKPASPANAAAPLAGVPCSALTRRACMDATPDVSSEADADGVPINAPPLPLPLPPAPRGDALPTTWMRRGARRVSSGGNSRRGRGRGSCGTMRTPGACVAGMRRPLPCVSAAAPRCGTAPAAGARARASDASHARVAPAGARGGARGLAAGRRLPRQAPLRPACAWDRGRARVMAHLAAAAGAQARALRGGAQW